MNQNCLKKLNWDFKIYEGCFLWFYADIKSAFLKESTVLKLNFKSRRTSMVSRIFVDIHSFYTHAYSKIRITKYLQQLKIQEDKYPVINIYIAVAFIYMYLYLKLHVLIYVKFYIFLSLLFLHVFNMYKMNFQSLEWKRKWT